MNLNCKDAIIYKCSNLMIICKSFYFIFRMDTNGSLQIDWNEWKKFHLLNPDAKDIKDMVKFWRHSGVSSMKFKCLRNVLHITSIIYKILSNKAEIKSCATHC